jgi:putative nucleotidyltransferase with HDIG domain
MVLSLSIFSAFDSGIMAAQDAERLWEHSVATSRLSRCIARAQGISGHALAPYQSAGLLHDLGKLVIATAEPKTYRGIAAIAAATGARPWRIENDVLGCSHAEIGAYLLGIWGLPSTIVEAVAWHHHPSDSPVTEFSPLTAVHVASVFHSQWHPEYKQGDPQLDQEFLERIGLAERQAEWIQICTEQLAEGGMK